MTKFKKMAIVGATVFTMGLTTITAFAASNYSNPAEAAAGVTGKTVEYVINEKNETGKTFGAIANEAGKLEEFKQEMLTLKKQILDEKVAAREMTQDEADKIYKAIEENIASCDGTGNNTGRMMGAGFGRMMGQGRGQGLGCGYGQIQ